MADAAITPIPTRPPLRSDGGTLGQPVDFDIRGSGRRLPKAEAPGGCSRPAGTHAKEKMRGAASMPKHEAQQKLADYVGEYTAGSPNKAIRSPRSVSFERPSARRSPVNGR